MHRLVALATGFLLITSFSFAQTSAPSQLSGEATFEGLGDLEGGAFLSVPSDVSADGGVVVGYSDSEPRSKAFRWEDGAMESLGDNLFYSLASGVSADGSVVAGYSMSKMGVYEAWQWENGTLEHLGDLEGGDFHSQAWGVSADGSAVVGWSFSENGQEAFRWENGAMEGLGDLEGGDFVSQANDISGNGSTVVGFGLSSNGYEAVQWADDTMEGLGLGQAYGVSTNGQILVGTIGSEAFRWHNGTLERLGDLEGGNFSSAAGDLSADGNVVVGRGTTASGPEAFIWTEAQGMRNLKEVLEDDYGLDLTDWTLVSASGVSDDGTVIVGAGFNPDGGEEAWRVVLPPTNSATIRFVNSATGSDTGDCSDEANPCATITYAIGQAESGDTIEIADGVYTEFFEIDKSLTLNGESETGTIIQAHEEPEQAESRVITIDGDYAVEIANLTIRHGVADGTFPDNQGGGVYKNEATLTMNNVTVGENTATFHGGGLENDGGSITLVSVTFSDNEAGDSGGGMHNVVTDSATLTNVTFVGNEAEEGGGGLFNVDSGPLLTNVVFSGNAAGFGGGMYNLNSSNGFPELANVTFSENVANSFGGGGMNNWNSSAILTNVTFGENTSTQDGGGISNGSGSSVTLVNTIVWGNTADGDGNEITNDGSSSIELFYSLYGNGEGDIAEGGGFTAENSLTNDPLFVDAESGNLRLAVGSPAIDAGDPEIDLGIFPTDENGDPIDLDGSPRVFGDLIDIGAYETQSVNPGEGTRYVNGTTGSDSGNNCIDEANPCATISYALGLATPGEAIEIADGEYTESLDINKSLTLHGESETGTIIQAHENPGETTSRVVTIEGDLKVDISKVTIRHGVSTGTSPNDRGGGLYSDDATLAITDVTFSENEALNGGGMCIEGGNATLQNVTFSGNTAENSGGGLSNSQSSSILTNVTFEGNLANTGAGMSNNASSPLLTNVTFLENIADSNGGGMYSSGSSAPTLTNVAFNGNMSGDSGGGMWNFFGSPTIINATFSGNEAESEGGGLYNSFGSPELTNVTFSNNASAQAGGGVWNGGGDSATMLNNTIVWGNATEGEGNEIYNEDGSSIELSYSLYGNNDGDIGGEGEFVAENSLTNDPLFVDAENGNLHLEDVSPAIGAGNPETDLELFPTNEEGNPIDLDGNPRVFGEEIDIGAYENQGIVVDEASPQEIAEVLSLPTPNPVRGIATFTVATEHGQVVTVNVFDTLGRRVQTLYEGELAAGTSETLTLDASTLPAGIYIIRAIGEDFAKTRRVTVAK